ncbi:alpha/beta fold hydrolase [Terasakiella sp. SH-1]|uniref:alpha/beta fold hydrolase n=1 Tax=Terasakiella sp. SH-1 TaxID=2560057 RepID=UPI001073A22D|nr:alpha/beta fold hydrolase [Terasakiella sp. SH-1]
MLRTLSALLLLFFLIACAPHMEGAGPKTGEADIVGDVIQTADGTQLPLRRWEPNSAPKAVLLGVHGFNDYGNFLMPGFPDYLAENGILLITYDQRGFGQTANRGLWAGTQTFVNDLASIIHLIHARYEHLPLYVMGESMGGAIVMNTMARIKPLPVEGIILSAPATWGMQVWPWYQKLALYTLSHTLPWLKLSGGGILQPTDHIENWHNWSRDPLVIRATRVDAVYGVSQTMADALNASPKITTPTLLLYGAKDEVIPAIATKTMLSSMTITPTFAFYENGWHWLPRDKNAQTVWADILSWINDAQQPLPSGADMDSRKRLEMQ